jgi:hypothetical protein
MKKEDVLKVLEEANKVKSTFTDTELQRQEYLVQSGHYSTLGKNNAKIQMENNIGLHTSNLDVRSQWAALGGKAVIESLNEKNKETGHWRKLGDSKIGVKRDDETKQKIKESSKHSWRPILQYTKDGKLIKEWKNFTEIEEVLSNELNKKIIKQPIWSVCNNKPRCKTAYGFIWKYKDAI